MSKSEGKLLNTGRKLRNLQMQGNPIFERLFKDQSSGNPGSAPSGNCTSKAAKSAAVQA